MMTPASRYLQQTVEKAIFGPGWAVIKANYYFCIHAGQSAPSDSLVYRPHPQGTSLEELEHVEEQIKKAQSTLDEVIPQVGIGQIGCRKCTSFALVEGNLRQFHLCKLDLNDLKIFI